jgi:hypothetical protein
MGWATKPKEPPKDWKYGMYTTLGILGIYTMFYGIIWLWAVMMNDDGPGPPSVWYMCSAYRDLQAKIDAPYALASLASCLQEAIPSHNATIKDVSACLKAMGMNES